MKLLTALGLTAALLLSGCGGDGTHLITGTITVNGTNMASGVLDGACVWSPETFGDIKVGARVTVKDGTGTIIGNSWIEKPIFVSGASCVYPYSVTVSDAESYSVEVGRGRAEYYSKVDLESQGWKIELTLGN